MKPRLSVGHETHRLSSPSDKGRNSLTPGNLKPPRRPSEVAGRRLSSSTPNRSADEGSYRDLLAENGRLLSKIEDLERRNAELQSHLKSEIHMEREKNLQLEMNIDEFQVLYAKSKEEVSSLHQQLSSARAECQRNWSLFDETRHTLEAERCEAASLREQVRHLRDAIDAEQRQRGVQTMQRDGLARRLGSSVSLTLDLASSDTHVDETDALDSVGANPLLFHSRTFSDNDLAPTSFPNQSLASNIEIPKHAMRAECDDKIDHKDKLDSEANHNADSSKHDRGEINLNATSEFSSAVDPMRTELGSIFEAVPDEQLRNELACAVCATQQQNDELRCECEQLQLQVSTFAESQQETAQKSEAVTELLRQNAELRHRCMKLRDQVSRAMDVEREVRRSDDMLFEGERLRDTFEEILDSRRYVEADLVQTIEDLHQKCERLRQQAGKSLERDRKSCKKLEKGVRRESRQGDADAGQLDDIRSHFLKLPSIQEEDEKEDPEQLNGHWQHEREQLREQVATVVEIEKERRKTAVNLSHQLEEQCKQLQENAANAEQAEAAGTHRQHELHQELNQMKIQMDEEVAEQKKLCVELEMRLHTSEEVEGECQRGIATAESEMQRCQIQESQLKQNLAKMEQAEIEAHQRVADGLQLSQRLFEEWQESTHLSQSQTNVFRTLEAELVACEQNTTMASESEHLARQRLEDQLYHEQDMLRREVNVSHSKDKIYKDLETELHHFEKQAEVSEHGARKNMEHVVKLVEEQCEENAGMQLKALEDKSKTAEQELRKAMEDRLRSVENKYKALQHGSEASESEFYEEMREKMRGAEAKCADHASKASEAEQRLRETVSECSHTGSKMQQECAEMQAECERFKHEVANAIKLEKEAQASAMDSKNGVDTLRGELEQRAAKTAQLESLKAECDHLRLEASGAATALETANLAVEEELRKSQSGHRKFESKIEAERRSSVAQYRTNKELQDEYNQLKREVLQACLVERHGRLALEEELQEECDRNEELETEWLQAALQIEQENDMCKAEEELAARGSEYESLNEELQEQVEDLHRQRKQCEEDYNKLQEQFRAIQIEYTGSIEEQMEEDRKNAIAMNRSLEFECTQLRDLAAGALDAERKSRLCAEHSVAEADMAAHRELLECENIQEQVSQAREAESKASKLAEQRLQKNQRLQQENDELKKAAATAGKRLSIHDGKKLREECEEFRENAETAESKLRKLRRSSGMQANKDLQRECQQLLEEQSAAQKHAELAHELEDANLQECLENARLEEIRIEAMQQNEALQARILILEEEFGVASGSVEAGLNLHQRLRQELELVVGSAEEDLRKHQNQRRDLERRHENAIGAAQAETEAHEQTQGEMQETIMNLRRRESNMQESAKIAIEAEETQTAMEQKAVEKMRARFEELQNRECDNRESSILALQAEQAEVAVEQQTAQELRQVLSEIRCREVSIQRQAETEEAEAAVQHLAVEELRQLLGEVQRRETDIQKQADVAAKQEQEAVEAQYEEIKAWAGEVQKKEADMQQQAEMLWQEMTSALTQEQEASSSAEVLLKQRYTVEEEKDNMEMLAQEAITSAKEEMELRGQAQRECEELEMFSREIANELWSQETILAEECRSFHDEASHARTTEAEVRSLLAHQHEQHQELQQQCLEMRSQLLGAFAEEREARDSGEVAMLDVIKQLRQEEVELEEQVAHAAEAELVAQSTARQQESLSETLKTECDALRSQANHAEKQLTMLTTEAADQTMSEGLLVECNELHQQLSDIAGEKQVAEGATHRCRKELQEEGEHLRELHGALRESRLEGDELENESRTLKVRNAELHQQAHHLQESSVQQQLAHSSTEVAVQREAAEKMRQLLAESQRQEEMQKLLEITSEKEEENAARWRGRSEVLQRECEELQAREVSARAELHEGTVELYELRGSLMRSNESDSELTESAARWQGRSNALHVECEESRAREVSALKELNEGRAQLQQLQSWLAAWNVRGKEMDNEATMLKTSVAKLEDALTSSEMRNAEMQQEAHDLQKSLTDALSSDSNGAEVALAESWQQNKALKEQVAQSNAAVVLAERELDECKRRYGVQLHIASANAAQKQRAYRAKQLLASMSTARMAFAALGKAASGTSGELLPRVEERQQTLLDQCCRLQEHAEHTAKLEERLHEMLAAKRQQRLIETEQPT